MTYIETRPPDPFSIAPGSQTMRREDVTSTALTQASGELRFSMFMARYNFVATKIMMRTGASSAGATPTLCRYGLYLLSTDATTLTLVGSSASDTSLFAATNTQYSKTLSSPVTMQTSARYGITALFVSGASAPSFTGVSAQADLFAIPPVMNGVLAGQSDLPASVAISSLGTTSQLFFASIAP